MLGLNSFYQRIGESESLAVIELGEYQRCTATIARRAPSGNSSLALRSEGTRYTTLSVG